MQSQLSLCTGLLLCLPKAVEYTVHWFVYLYFLYKVHSLCVKREQIGLCCDFGVKDYMHVLFIACVGFLREIDPDFTV